jgi:predicted RNA-binding protein with PUA-like domain
MKTEPDVFGIDDLARVGVEPWTGVRNTWARGYMKNQMTAGDGVLFYHSSCDPPGVAGLARVERTGVVDETQFDPASPYFDAKATREAPVWWCVDVAFVEKLPRLVSLEELRATRSLKTMMVLRVPRLSVQPVTDKEWRIVLELARKEKPDERRRRDRARVRARSRG